MADEDVVDYAIIGGGIAGLYCAYQIFKKHPDTLKIALFEASDRLGGRIETWRIDAARFHEDVARPDNEGDNVGSDHLPVYALPEFAKAADSVDPLNDTNNKITPETRRTDLLIAEFGPMRIEPDHQPYLNKLLLELDIKPFDGKTEKWTDLIPFPPYQGPPPDEPQFKLDEEEAAQATLVDLLLLALRRCFEIMTFRGEPVHGVRIDPINPWRLGPPWTSLDPNDNYQEKKSKPFDEANYFWREFRDKEYLHRKIWKRNLMQWIKLLDEPHYAFIVKHAEFRGTLLRDMGFWNLLASVLSHMATIKLRDWGSFYHLLPVNPSAATWLVFWLRALKSTDALKGIRGGMDILVHELCKKLDWSVNAQETALRNHVVYEHNEDSRIKLHLNHELIKVEQTCSAAEQTIHIHVLKPDEAGQKRLQTIQVKNNLIMALPKAPLDKIEFIYNNNRAKWIYRLLDSVSGIPLLKCFFVVDTPFWEDNRPPNRYAHTAPTRELHYWKSEDRKTGLLMIYTDTPATQFWSDYLVQEQTVDLYGKQGHGSSPSLLVLNRWQGDAKIWRWTKGQGTSEAYHSWSVSKFGNDRLLRTFLLYAQHDGAESVTADRVLAAGMKDWGLAPYGGAAHAWRPGTDPACVISYLSQFSLADEIPKPGEGKLHICGEAYSDFQGFIEGALRSSALVLTKHDFGIKNKDLTGVDESQRPSLPRTLRPPEESRPSD